MRNNAAQYIHNSVAKNRNFLVPISIEKDSNQLKLVIARLISLAFQKLAKSLSILFVTFQGIYSNSSRFTYSFFKRQKFSLEIFVRPKTCKIYGICFYKCCVSQNFVRLISVNGTQSMTFSSITLGFFEKMVKIKIFLGLIFGNKQNQISFGIYFRKFC